MSNRFDVTIALTGLNNTDNPGPGVPVIRALRESTKLNVKIIGLVYENLEPGIYMKDLTDKIYMIPYPSGGSDAFVKRLIEINSKTSFDFIIPNLDAELYTFMKSEKTLNQHGIRAFLPGFEQFEERQKNQLVDFGKKYNVLVPDGINLTSVLDIPKISDHFDYPVYVKGKFYDAYLAFTPEHVAGYFHQLNAKWGLPVIIQQNIIGTELNVVALGDGTGKTIAAVPMRKQYITDKGKAWGGITITDQKLLQITHRLIQRTKWRGGMELEIIKTAEGKYYLIEINPRIPAWVYLAVAAGQNIPEALILLAMEQTPEPMTHYDVGKMFVRYSYDLIADIHDFQKISIDGEI